MDNLIGRSFGGYELTEPIGAEYIRFNKTRIYKAFDEKLARWAIVRLIPVRFGKQTVEDYVLAKIKERAQAIATLRHCNISIFYGYGIEEEWAYTITEYVRRSFLKQHLDAGTALQWEQALDIAIHVAQALVFAHDQNVIHRNIKPANILMPRDDWPLLAFDLELAEMLSWPIDKTNLEREVGEDLMYAAPEQIQDNKIDARTDIYSLGLVLYQLLSGKLPFKGKTSFDLLMARLIEPPLLLPETNPAIVPAFRPVLNKALALNPDDRYQTMGEFAQALIQTREELSLSSENKTQIIKEINGAISLEAVQPAMDPDYPQETKIVLRLIDSDARISVDEQPELIVGRASKSTGRVPQPTIDLAPHGGRHAGVSRQHSRLLRKQDQWFIEDLGSTNGTFINGIKIPPNLTVPVAKGDFLRFGQIELEFELAAQ